MCFKVGALDQGYWPDGVYTAPTDAALKSDIVVAKQLGFNLLRKHAKVEPDRWYYWTDKLGMLVWQDMPQAFGDLDDAATKAQWLTEWKSEVAQFYNHPSIIVWTTFNEGWGQHDTEADRRAHQAARPEPPGQQRQRVDGQFRLASATSTTPTPTPARRSEKPEPTRAAVNGEFGGVTLRVDGHTLGVTRSWAMAGS